MGRFAAQMNAGATSGGGRMEAALWADTPRTLPKQVGSNRFTWDLRYDGGGTMVAPGKYQLKLSGDGWSRTQTLDVRLDPRLEKTGDRR